MIISHGAEAIISKEEKQIKKERIKKSYRIKELDESLRRRRTKSETTLIRDARRAGVKTPQILDTSDFTIKMEFIEGITVRDTFDKQFKELSSKIGKAIASLHSFDIIHGDLTTSNMIFCNDEVYFIDFGLGYHSKKIEDKAVDLHLLRQVLESTHFSVANGAWNIILKAYTDNYKESDNIIKRLSQIEKRGRYRVR